jgi:hypothetical protein
MSQQIQRRLEEVLWLIPCPVSGCWFLHGAETAYLDCHRLSSEAPVQLVSDRVRRGGNVPVALYHL